MSTCYHPFRNIAYVHTPRCAGTNISRTLICNNDFIDAEKQKWYRNAYEPLLNISNISEYTIIGVVRHPVTWLWSGYNFTYQYFELSLKEHLECVLNPWFLLINHKIKYNLRAFNDWYWHSCILPDKHLPDNTKIFKFEKLNELEAYLDIKLYDKEQWKNNQYNTMISPPLPQLTDEEKKLIKQIAGEYAEKWNYEFNF